MIAREEVHKIVGETLELAQFLEEAITVPIMMLFIIESGLQKDLGPDDISQLINEAKAGPRPPTTKPVNEKFRQNMRAQMGQIMLMVQNGTMGELKRKLESKLHITPGGPSASIESLQNALDARNFLCHGFFKKHLTNTDQDAAMQSALSELNEMQDKFRKAIGFAEALAASLHDMYPKTFTTTEKTLH